MKKHVYVRGEKIPVRLKKLYGFSGLAFQSIKGRKSKKWIELDKAMRTHEQLVTLVHEMLHQARMDLSEKTVSKLETCIVGMVEENPEVFSELSNLLEKK